MMYSDICDHIKEIHCMYMDSKKEGDPRQVKSHYAVIMPSYKTVNWADRISFGISRNDTHKFMCSTHAEVDAISKIRKWRNLPKVVDLYVIRLSRSGLIGESKPCIHCMYMLRRTRVNIKNIYCSNEHGEIIKLKFDSYEASHICSGMRTQWRKKKRLL